MQSTPRTTTRTTPSRTLIGAGRSAVRAGVLVGVLAVAAVLGGCSSTTGNTVAGTSFVSGDGTITVVAPEQRRQPVDLAGTTLDGAALNLASYRGKTVVLNVWGSWCSPCRKEAPDLQAAATELAPTGVAFIGINTRDDTPEPALAFQKTFGVTYPSLVDKGGQLLLSLRGAVSPKTIPTTLVLDSQGRIAARIAGTTTKITLVSLVEDVRDGRPLGMPASGAS